MVEQASYTSHLAVGNSLEETACGEPWQGWQAPDGYNGNTIPPNTPPKPHQTEIRLCQACRRVAFGEVK